MDRVQSEWRRTGSQKFDCVGSTSLGRSRSRPFVSYYMFIILFRCSSSFFLSFSFLIIFFTAVVLFGFFLSFFLLFIYFLLCCSFFSPPIKDQASAEDALTPY